MKKLNIVLSMLVIFISSIVLTGCLGGGRKPAPTFSISGYVYCGTTGVEGVTLKSDVGETTTDKNGYYSFDGLSDGITITAEKENYAFLQQTQVFFNGTTNANFIALPYYNVSGYVKSGEIGIENVKISAKGKKDGFTYSTKDGHFIIYNVAGEVKLTAEKEGYKFFDKEITIDASQNVEINATTNICGKINFLGLSKDYKDSASIFIDNNKLTLNGDEFTYNEALLGSVVELKSDFLVFSPKKIVINSENQLLNFTANKIYNYSGYVKSGETPLENVKISLKDKVLFTDSKGYFELNNLIGDNILKFYYENFLIKDLVITENSESSIIQATTNVSGKILFNEAPIKGAKIYNKSTCAYSDSLGTFTVNNLKIGDTIFFEYDGYKLDLESYIVKLNNDKLLVNSNKIYDAKIVVNTNDNAPIEKVKITIDNKDYFTDSQGIANVKGLIKEHNILCHKEGYFIESIEKISYLNPEIRVVAKKYYNAKLTIKSGSIILAHTICSISGVKYTSNDVGEIILDDLLEDKEYSICIDGYNKQNFSLNMINNNISLNLSYDISGKIISGDLSVNNAKIYNDNVSVYSDIDGNFNIKNLYGENTFSICKKDYSFENNITTTKESNNIIIDSTYKIYGIAKNEVAFLKDVDIFLFNTLNDFKLNTKTNDSGEFEFLGVKGSCFLFYDTNYNLKLRPLSYQIFEGGKYDFMLNGFELGGFVKCGDIPIEGAKVIAGTNTVYTDENGKYYFSLLTNDCSISVEKEGYLFLPSTISVTSDDNERKDINFDSTYQIEGVITCGSSVVPDAKIKIKDKEIFTNSNGYFIISNLKGNNKIVIEKQGYNFEEIIVSGYKNLTINSTFNVKGIAKTGNISIKDAKITYNGKEISTNDKGEFLLENLTTNDSFVIEKTGYKFINNFVLIDPTNIVVNATYTIVGTVKSSLTPVKDVKIMVGKKSYFTNEFGQFKISGLIGENILEFYKEGYEFTNKKVSCPQDYIIYATFSVSGYIKLNDKGLNDVLVSSQGIVVKTNEMGFYKLSGLMGVGELVLEKKGYEFIGNKTFENSSILNFKATYSVSGKIVSGNISLQGVSVTYGNNEILSDENGLFSINNLDGVVKLSFKKQGYNIKEIEVKDYKDNLDINITYNVEINFASSEVLKDVIINIKNETNQTKETATGKSITLKNLSGENILSFIKNGYAFTPSIIGVDKPGVLTITVEKIYQINGRVFVEGTNIPIKNFKITAGGKTTYTDELGKYKIDGLVGPNQLNGILEYRDCTAIESESIQVNEKSTTNDIKIHANKYGYFLFEKGYLLLSETKSSYVTVEGTVALSMGGNQTVRGIRKKDSKGNILTEKINYGETVFGIDPRVALLTYYNKNTKELKYQQVKNIDKNYNATYRAFKNSNLSEYKSIYGVYPYDDYAYIINPSTINSITDIKNQGTDTLFTIALNPNLSTANYRIQMKALSGKDTSKFNFVNLTYTIDENGYIKELKINEQYIVNAGFEVTGTANLVEKYFVKDKDTILTDINLSDIKKSLKYEVITPVSNNNLFVSDKKSIRRRNEKYK